MGILSVDLDKVNLDDVNFDDGDTDTVIHVGLLVWHNRFKQCKAFKKEIRKKLMLVAWLLTRWWDWCMPEKKGIEQIFTDKN